MRHTGALIAWAMAAASAGPGRSVETAPAPDRLRAADPLATKQQIVHDRMTQLEDRVFRMAEQLASSDPQQAERLAQALRRARELLIRRNMDEAIRLLETGEVTEAADRQLIITRDLEEVLKVLLEDPDDTERHKKEIERLEQFREQIEKLLEDERGLKKQVDSVPQLDQAEAAQRQRALKQAAGKLAADMRGQVPDTQPAASRPDGGNQGGGSSPPDPQGGPPAADRSPPSTPGAENVEQAGGHMEDAADELDRQAPAAASEAQQAAIEQLEQARRELQEALDMVRRQQQEEILRGLESRLRAMLAQQLAINTGTDELQTKGRGAWTHSDELRLAGLARDEASLAEQAALTLRLLKEEGTTIVFPRIVEQVRAQVQEAAQLLEAGQTGPETQRLEAEIVATLEELIEAVKEKRTQLAAGEAPPGSGEGGKNPPLLPDSAEFKLLRSCQQRVNRATQAFKDAHAGATELTDADRRVLDQIARRQREVADMARKVNERATGQ